MNFRSAMVMILACGFARGESLLDAGFRQMYNLQFDEAHRSFAEYQRANPGDPLGAVSDAAAYLFSEFNRLNILRSQFAIHDENFTAFAKPLVSDPRIQQLFEASLTRSQMLAAPGLSHTPPDPNAMFATTLRLGLHADYLALIEKRDLSALAEIKQARIEATKLLTTHPEFYDAWIAIGLENYLLSLKPAPVRWVLDVTGSQTNRQAGLDKLRLTEEKGRFLAPYAKLLLAVAALRDNDVRSAQARLASLAREFPGNRLYREELAKLQ